MLNPIDLYKQVETLSLEERFSDIVELEKAYLRLDSSDLDLEKLIFLTEIFAWSYMKLSLQEKQAYLSSQYKIALRYEKMGGRESDILIWKLNIEESLYMRYVKVNKYFLYVILLIVLLVNLDFLPNTENYIPVLTAIAVAWYFLNFVMNCRVKRFYLQIIRRIYS
jgi:hypothetical protein